MTELPLASCCPPVGGAALSEDDATQAANAFKALADPVRIRLLSLIAAQGEACVCDLPALVDRSQPTVSHHLKVLADAGLVEREQRGRWAWFRVRADQLDGLRAALVAPTA